LTASLGEEEEPGALPGLIGSAVFAFFAALLLEGEA